MFARTDRLLLRPGWREDAPALLNAIADEAIIDKLPGTPWPYLLEDAEAYLTQDGDFDALPQLLIHVRTRGAPRLIGGIALRACRGAGHGRRAELDYWITRSCWGLGFATEAGRAVVDMARNGLRLAGLSSSHSSDNPASRRVLEKLGFRPTGRSEPRWSTASGRDVQYLIYAHAA